MAPRRDFTCCCRLCCCSRPRPCCPAALAHGVKARLGTGARFALCWLIPAWLVFELAPTKLPHYTLPLYGALAWLMAAAMSQPIGRVSRIMGAGLSILAGGALAASLSPWPALRRVAVLGGRHGRYGAGRRRGGCGRRCCGRRAPTRRCWPPWPWGSPPMAPSPPACAGPSAAMGLAARRRRPEARRGRSPQRRHARARGRRGLPGAQPRLPSGRAHRTWRRPAAASAISDGRPAIVEARELPRSWLN